MKRISKFSVFGLIALFLSTPLLVTASGLVTFDVKYPQGEEISKDLQFVYSAKGGGYETICVSTLQSLDCDIVGTSTHNGIDLLWGDFEAYEKGGRQVVVLTTEEATFLMVLDSGLVDIDQITEHFPYIGEIKEMTIIETNTIIKTQEPNPTQPIETPTPSPTEDNKCGHFGPHSGTPVAGEEYACKGGN